MIQQPTDSSERNRANISTAYSGQTDKRGTAIRS